MDSRLTGAVLVFLAGKVLAILGAYGLVRRRPIVLSGHSSWVVATLILGGIGLQWPLAGTGAVVLAVSLALLFALGTHWTCGGTVIGIGETHLRGEVVRALDGLHLAHTEEGRAVRLTDLGVWLRLASTSPALAGFRVEPRLGSVARDLRQQLRAQFSATERPADADVFRRLRNTGWAVMGAATAIWLLRSIGP